MTDDPGDVARAYYRHLDDGDYDALRSLLADEFVQHRPDMTLESADRFVAFMRDERPETDTTHVVEWVYRTDADTTPHESDDATVRVAVEGRLERANGDTWFRFVDTFSILDGELTSLTTYTQ